MRLLLGYAILITLFSVSETSAQNAPITLHDFSGLTVGRTITVVDDNGWGTSGQVRSFTPDRLTLAVKGRDTVFDRSSVTSAFEQKRSVKKGMSIGLLAGLGLGVAGLVSSASGDDYAQAGAAIMVPLGVGIGTAVGALIPSRRLLYERPGSADNFRGLASGRVVTVATDSGGETSGRLLRFTTDELTLTVSGRERTFARQQITAIFERGDSIKNGLKWGFLIGAAVGLADGATRDLCGPDFVGIGIYCSGDRAGHVARHGVGLAALGAVIGAGVDAMVRGRRALYEKQKGPNARPISILPTFAPSRTGLQMSVSW